MAPNGISLNLSIATAYWLLAAVYLVAIPVLLTWITRKVRRLHPFIPSFASACFLTAVVLYAFAIFITKCARPQINDMDSAALLLYPAIDAVLVGIGLLFALIHLIQKIIRKRKHH